MAEREKLCSASTPEHWFRARHRRLLQRKEVEVMEEISGVLEKLGDKSLSSHQI